MSFTITALQNLSFRTRRVIAGVILIVMLVAEGNYYLQWHLFGAADAKVVIAALALGLAFYAAGGVNINEIREYRDRKRREQRQ